jgi:hypothetical protein
MKQPKKKVALSGLGSQHQADNLRRFYPFLRNQYRLISLDEIQSEKVFKELFGDNAEVNLEHLNALYQFQQCDIKTRTTSTGSDSIDSAKA